MDRIINNESVAICSIINAMVLDIDEVAKLNLFVIMVTDRAIRSRMKSYLVYEDMVRQESAYFQALHRKFIEFQPIFMNAMTMLLLSGKIENTGEGHYTITADCQQLALELQDITDGVIDDVKQAAIKLADLIGDKDVKVLYKDLGIVL